MVASDLSAILTKEERETNYGHSEESVWQLVAPRLIHDALRRLLEDRHLYQSVEVGDAAVAKQIIAYWRDLPPSSGSGASPGGVSTWGPANPLPVKQVSAESKEQRATTAFAKVLAAPWRAEVLRSPGGHRISGGQQSTFGVPTKPGKEAEEIIFSAPRAVRTHCQVCDARTPFNPVAFFGFEAVEGWTGEGRSEDEQHFGYSYECQNCPGPKRGRVVFLAIRRGGKITLCGRDPLEAVSVEVRVAKSLQKFVSAALVAHHAGQTLSGLFQMRTFIEQFWRTVPAVETARLEALKAGKRLSGDELADIYAKPLPELFKAQFPSLGKIYSDLSAAMHDAKQGDEAVAVFTAALAAINKHFDALRVFDLTPPKTATLGQT